ncbi:hypothetical protein LUZ60_011300 [Juncus effusus]|nr:hypothetical protein LUZ60_011300 [Juncus effusus]
MEASSSSSMAGIEKKKKTCSICLGPVRDEAFLDRCFHSFCYKCISEWLSFVATRHSNPLSSFACPLCKSENLSIIHGINGESFQRHYANEKIRSLSNAHILRLNVYNTQKDMRNKKPDILQYWKKRKYLHKNNWLQIWLRREIQALVQEENVEIIFCHIYGVIESFMKRQEKESPKRTFEQKREEFRGLLANASRPFLQDYTDRFVNELELFLASGLNINAYDKYFSHESTQIDSEPLDRSVQDKYFNFLDEENDYLTD